MALSPKCKHAVHESCQGRDRCSICRNCLSIHNNSICKFQFELNRVTGRKAGLLSRKFGPRHKRSAAPRPSRRPSPSQGPVRARRASGRAAPPREGPAKLGGIPIPAHAGARPGGGSDRNQHPGHATAGSASPEPRLPGGRCTA